MSKEKKVSQEAAQDYVTNKLLSVFTVAFVMILGVMYCSRSFGDWRVMYATWETVKILVWVLLALTVIFAIIAIAKKTQGKTKKYKIITAKHLSVVFGFATACCGALAMAYSPNTVNFLYVVIPTITVLFIVYHTYPRDFFAISLIAAFGAIGLWLTGSAISGGMGASKLWLIIGFVAAVLAVLVVATIVIQANGGKLCRKCKCALFDEDAKYGLIYLTIAIIATLLVATWVMVGAATYYFLFGLLAYFVVVGIYYTLKML